MTASHPTPRASWSSRATRLRGKHSILRTHSWLPHRALNGSNGWTHNHEAREFAGDTAVCGSQQHIHRWRDKGWIGNGWSSFRYWGAVIWNNMPSRWYGF